MKLKLEGTGPRCQELAEQGSLLAGILITEKAQPRHGERQSEHLDPAPPEADMILQPAVVNHLSPFSDIPSCYFVSA